MSLDDDAQWCREHFARMNLGGVWGVPRTGLIFKKINYQTLELIEVIPGLAGQAEDFDLIKHRFSLAGIRVIGREMINRTLH